MAERSQTAPEAGNDMGNDEAIGGNVSKYIVLPTGYCGQPKKGHLIFDACFESGNLGRVDQVSEFEYDLFIRPDTCNPRFRVWFNFTVENVKESQRVIFNIVNFSKTKSLYRDGMAPMVKSTSRPKWQRLPPKNVYYYRCPDHRKNYVMSFAFCFDREEDIYQFAYCYPYTYTRFQHYLDSLQKRNMDYFFREQLGQSVQQRQLDLLTITSPEPHHPVLFTDGGVDCKQGSYSREMGDLGPRRLPFSGQARLDSHFISPDNSEITASAFSPESSLLPCPFRILEPQALRKAFPSQGAHRDVSMTAPFSHLILRKFHLKAWCSQDRRDKVEIDTFPRCHNSFI
uniref:Cytosolic carboxypeptidase N-terminal domain-containing protein n=1 Tax=Equus caballus TaxID=9796 RepID=A0A3Q2I0X1_HORSE